MNDEIEEDSAIEAASRGLGGTAQIVEHARHVQKPLILIRPTRWR